MRIVWICRLHQASAHTASHGNRIPSPEASRSAAASDGRKCMRIHLVVVPDDMVDVSDGAGSVPLLDDVDPVVPPAPEVPELLLPDVSVLDELGVLDELVLGEVDGLVLDVSDELVLGVLDEPEVPLLMEPDELPEPDVLVSVVLLPMLPDALPVLPLVPLVPLVPDALEVSPLALPEELLPIVDAPLLGSSFDVVVVVVVVAAAPLLPAGVLKPVDDDSFGVSVVVVVVVVACPNVALAAPIRDRKMAKGNFFMFAP